MPKTSKKLRCKNCKKLFKTAYGLTQHLKYCTEDKPLNKLKICDVCKQFFNKSKYKKHNVSCQCRQFFNEYGLFFDFLYKLIILYNIQNDKNNLLRFNDEKKYYIFQKKIETIENIDIKKEENDLKNNKNYIIDNINFLHVYFKEKKQERENLLNDLNINNNDKNIKIITLVETANQTQNIGLSFRQIIFDYIGTLNKNEDVINKIKNKINKKYKKKDFFTNDEIKEISTELSAKVLFAMHTNHLYFDKYNYYYNILKEFGEGNKDKYLCIFCNKYYYHKWTHYKKCFYLKESFKQSVSNTFYKFINNNFKKEELDKVIPEQIIKKYIERDFYFFISHIRENIINCGAFESSINFYNYSYKINKIKIENRQLEEFLHKIYKEFEEELNPFLKRKIREYTINYYLENKKYDKRIIKKYIINELKNEKIEKENEMIINKISKSNNMESLYKKSFDMEEKEEEDINKIGDNFKNEFNKIFKNKYKIIENKKNDEDTLSNLSIDILKDNKEKNEEDLKDLNLLKDDDNSENYSLSYLNNII